MNVLSLFDGMSCGQIALERAGIKVDNYFASEIDKYAIKVTQSNYPNTKQLGDVQFVTGQQFDAIGGIDLLIGGSPCQGFSFVGKQLNFEDARSKLFFEFVRLLKETEPKYFLLENVKMKKECQDIISDHLGVEPIEINSSLVSAQNRKRLYWTNIPNIKQPNDKKIILSEVIDHSFTGLQLSEKAWDYLNRNSPKWSNGKRRLDIYDNNIDKKALCLTANMYKGIPYGVISKLNRRLTPIECERLQTVPDNYTSSVSNTQRYKMLGNGWTVDVIAHILSFIKK